MVIAMRVAQVEEDDRGRFEGAGCSQMVAVRLDSADFETCAS